MTYLPYEEPGISLILTLTSLIFLLNGIRYILDRLLYCGLVGQILIGVIWGEPVGGTTWLSEGTQKAIQDFGYLGLIGLVFEGGLGTDLVLLRKTAYISISVATVGLLMPIAISFVLLVFPFPSSSGTLYPSPLAAFSAGASLCSTSLGTTLSIMSAAGMHKTRTGVTLLGAAMMDDVVGLVMVNIITTLGAGGSGGWSIARPIVASFGLLIVTMCIVPYILKPVWALFRRAIHHNAEVEFVEAEASLGHRLINAIAAVPHLQFVLPTAVLIIFVTIASFIDASVLFSAFIAGGLVNYLWNVGASADPAVSDIASTPSGMFEEYYKPVMEYILVPFFFASIGFSIPITAMFSGSIVWKGIVYAILMVVAKGLVSLVVYFDFIIKALQHPMDHQSKAKREKTQAITRQEPSTEQTTVEAPHSAALLIAFAMIARGEIGFLIASLSQSSNTLTLRYTNGENAASSGEEIFLVIVWAVVLCTIFGPVAVGVLVRHLKNTTAPREL
ncbi:hypothetical protein BP6252_06987 [Coleophoma cylindrospora]|uniref:Cation/H+ exchanger transmembrane domain-containing protein n=1 Tax=Coleophoma cylindrospora TaxID=1849047 RepID=A0A3D8RGI8_9HELO|nr:hypothetical protein BP6252_06987 [Coleophoma cylindrospora]